jgi:hypothetical protein
MLKRFTADQCLHLSFVAKLGTFFHVYAYEGWPWGGVMTTAAEASPAPPDPRENPWYTIVWEASGRST